MSMAAPVFRFTGMSGMGRTSIARGAEARPEAEGPRVLTLDGDDVRARFHRDLGFTAAEIEENNALIAALCRERLRDVGGA